MMIRARIPGGIIPPDQYLAFDDLSERYGNQTLRITSRQSFQWHGVVKGQTWAANEGSQRGALHHHRRVRRREPQRHGGVHTRHQRAGRAQGRRMPAALTPH